MTFMRTFSRIAEAVAAALLAIIFVAFILQIVLRYCLQLARGLDDGGVLDLPGCGMVLCGRGFRG